MAAKESHQPVSPLVGWGSDDTVKSDHGSGDEEEEDFNSDGSDMTTEEVSDRNHSVDDLDDKDE